MSNDSNDERFQRYADAVSVAPYVSTADGVRAVMAVADAEQAELRAKLAGVEALASRCERMGRDAIDQANRELLPAFAASLRVALAGEPKVADPGARG